MRIMDLFKFWRPATTELPVLEIDLGRFCCGHTKIGNTPDLRDPFTEVFERRETIKDVASGLELGVENGTLNYVLITLAQSDSRFLRAGSPLELSTKTSIS